MHTYKTELSTGLLESEVSEKSLLYFFPPDDFSGDTGTLMYSINW